MHDFFTKRCWCRWQRRNDYLFKNRKTKIILKINKLEISSTQLHSLPRTDFERKRMMRSFLLRFVACAWKYLCVCVCEIEYVREHMWVCMWYRMRVCERLSTCERVCVSVCVWERESVCVCDRECVKERECVLLPQNSNILKISKREIERRLARTLTERNSVCVR